MPDSLTPRFALPLLFAGQAQKEFTVNEAVLRADIALHACVEGELASPPSDPEPGQCWIVAASPTGAFAGQFAALAAWTAGGWRFVAARSGLQVYDTAAACWRRWTGAEWTLPTMPAVATGGTVIDVEARDLIATILEKLGDAGIFAAS